MDVEEKVVARYSGWDVMNPNSRKDPETSFWGRHRHQLTTVYIENQVQPELFLLWVTIGLKIMSEMDMALRPYTHQWKPWAQSYAIPVN
jgi:hypothetical protein